MSEPTSTSPHSTRRLSGRARAGIGGGIGLAAAIVVTLVTLVISGTAGSTAADETGLGPSSMVVEGSGASDQTGTLPSSMVVEGSGASDAVGYTDPATGVTVLEGDMLIAPESREYQIDEPLSGPSSMVVEGSGASDETGTAPASMVIEGSGASDATGYTDPTTGVTILKGDMLLAPRTASL